MGNGEPERTESNFSRDVLAYAVAAQRTYLGFEDRNAEFVRRLAAQKPNRSLYFEDEELAAACGKLVDGTLRKSQGILLDLNENVPTHPHHGQDVVLYMPETHPIPLVFDKPILEFPTEAGYAVVIPANQWHLVPMNTSGRKRFTIGFLYNPT